MKALHEFALAVDPRLLIAGGLGALIGLERELAGKDPSLRTFSLIALGSCLFGIISIESVRGVEHGDPSRIAAQIVTGIGFLGAGAIFRSEHRVNGLTTAALMWCTAAIGIAVAFNQTALAVTATLLGFMLTVGLRWFHLVIDRVTGAPPRSKPQNLE